MTTDQLEVLFRRGDGEPGAHHRSGHGLGRLNDVHAPILRDGGTDYTTSKGFRHGVLILSCPAKPRPGRGTSPVSEAVIAYRMMVEAPGIEPGSEAAFHATSTSVVPVLISPSPRPGTRLGCG